MAKDKKEKRVKRTKQSKDKDAGPVFTQSAASGGGFKKNVEVQTLQLRVALQQQVEATEEVRKEMSQLNEEFEVEVDKRKRAEAELSKLNRQFSLFTSKARGLERQLADERRKTEETKLTVIDPRKRMIASSLPAPV